MLVDEELAEIYGAEIDKCNAALAWLEQEKAAPATVGECWEPVEHEFRQGKLATWDDGIEDGDGVSDWWIRIDDLAFALGDDLRLCRQVPHEGGAAPAPLYSHRNGESEPPTVNGWFGYDGPHYNSKILGRMMPTGVNTRCFLLVEVGETQTIVWSGDEMQPIGDFPGKWHGPIQVPWEQQRPGREG